MSSIDTKAPPRSPLKSADGYLNYSTNSARTESMETTSAEKQMETPVKREENITKSFEEIRKLLDPVLFAKICEAVHHDKSTNSLEDEIEEIVEEVFPQFYLKENVLFKWNGTTLRGVVQSSEKRGALRFYYFTVDGTKLQNRVDASAVRRKYTPSEKELKVLLENIAFKEPGKAWQVKEEIRNQYNIKDKFASIFCAPKINKLMPGTGRIIEYSSSDDEKPSVIKRLSGIGVAPNKASSKKAAGVSKEPKKKQKEENPKKVKEKNEKKQENGKENKDKGSQKEKKRRTPSEKKQKKDKDGKEGNMSKFVRNSSTGSHSSQASPFMSPSKRSERRMTSALQKLSDSWKKRDYQEFLKSCAWSAKSLSGVQIDTITHEVFRLAVRKIFEMEKDKINLKKIVSADKKKEYRATIINERRKTYRAVDAKIKNHFNGTEVVEDLMYNDEVLPCPGVAVTLTDQRGTLFPDCMQVIQFLSSLRKFVGGVDDITTAEDLCNGIHEGRPGYYKHSVKVFTSLVKTLLQDVEYKMYTHIDARLRELNINECTVSELCRALLIGKTRKESKLKLTGQKKQSLYEDDSNDEEEERQNDVTENGEQVKNGETDEGTNNDPQQPAGCVLFEEAAKDETMDGRASSMSDSKPNSIKESSVEVLEPAENNGVPVKEEATDEGEDRRNEKEETAWLLSKFTAAHEIWQLEPSVQMHLLKVLLYRVIELESCRDFMTEDISSDDAKNLKARVVKLQSQVVESRDALAKLPEYDENVDESTLSRQQGRERAELARKRENLERKIADQESKIEELLDKIQADKMLQAQSKRLNCIGEDRHCRRYYWVPHKSVDAGLWIQDFGITNFERFVRQCVDDGETLDENFEVGLVNGKAKPNKKCANENIYNEENWFRVEDPSALNQFVAMLKNGTREKELKKFLTNNMELVTKAITWGKNGGSKSGTPDEKEHKEEQEETIVYSDHSLDYLKTTVINLCVDLKDGYLTSLDSAVFEAEVVSCETLDAIKGCILELVDTVKAKNITVKYNMKDAKETGSYSWFVIDKWKARLQMAQNASAIHLLMCFFESRIDWNNSVKDKRCYICNSKRTPEAKMSCSGCKLVGHYYCVRPKFLEKPPTWSCAACTRQDVLLARAAKAKPKYVESEPEEEEEEDDYAEEEEEDTMEETEEDEKGDTAMDSDVFAADSDDDKESSELPQTSRKRKLEESDGEEHEEHHEAVTSARASHSQEMDSGGRTTRASRSAQAKRHKMSETDPRIMTTWTMVKSSNRIYRTLQNVPQPRRTRGQATALSLEAIELALIDYDSYESFVADLRLFFDHAREYFENHNERKLDELDELIVSLNLPEIK